MVTVDNSCENTRRQAIAIITVVMIVNDTSPVLIGLFCEMC